MNNPPRKRVSREVYSLAPSSLQRGRGFSHSTESGRVGAQESFLEIHPFPQVLEAEGFRRIGPAGFEPTTSCTPSRRATKLRYGPMNLPRYSDYLG